jgi:DNA-binding Lrp family transcriptional regulator
MDLMNKPVLLSELDKRILNFIEVHGLFESKSIIAKKLRISSSTLNYRLNQLEKMNVVSGYKFRCDFSKIGLIRVSWFLIKLNRSKSDLDELFDFFSSFSQIHRIYFITGEFDLVLKIYEQNTTELSSFLFLLDNFIAEKSIESNSFFVLKRLKSHYISSDSFNSEKKTIIKKNDLKVIDFFLRNPEKKLIDASKSLELHINSVRKIWHKLIAEKIFFKKSALFNPIYWSQTDFGLAAIILFQAKPGEKEKLSELLSKINEITDLCIISGKYDFFSIAKFKDVFSFYLLQKKFFEEKEFKNLIKDVTSFIILRDKVKKGSYFTDLGVDSIIKLIEN